MRAQGITPAFHGALLVVIVGVWAAVEFFGLPLGGAVLSALGGGNLIIVSIVLVAALLLMLGGGLWVAMALLCAGFLGMALTGRPVGNARSESLCGGGHDRWRPRGRRGRAPDRRSVPLWRA